MLARSQLVLGRGDDAVKSYEEVLRRTAEPTAADLRGAIGARLTRDGDAAAEQDVVFELLQQLQGISPNDPMALFYMGNALAARGQRRASKRLLIGVSCKRFCPRAHPCTQFWTRNLTNRALAVTPRSERQISRKIGGRPNRPKFCSTYRARVILQWLIRFSWCGKTQGGAV